MLILQRLNELPGNFDEFVEEVCRGLTALHGAEAADEYRQVASRAVRQAIESPAVDAVAVLDGQSVAGLLLAVSRGASAQISFVHVLERYAGRALEKRLITEAVRTLRAGGVDAITSEFVPMCELDLANAYAKLGFKRLPRLLMARALDETLLKGPMESVACPPHAFPRAAEVIADAYTEHPERELHMDVRDVDSATAFLKASSAGTYGPAQRDFLRTISRQGAIAGVIVGCRAAPGLGFVLQVAVRRRFQGEGVGRRLMLELARVFVQAGLSRMGLGVTVSNPARILYERLGFTPLREVDAYVWWRP